MPGVFSSPIFDPEDLKPVDDKVKVPRITTNSVRKSFRQFLSFISGSAARFFNRHDGEGQVREKSSDFNPFSSFSDSF